MRREARREQLLDCALGLIARSGYDGVTITAVARAAEVTRPVVYGIFPTIEDLQVALLEREATELFTRVAAIFDTGIPRQDPVELWLTCLGQLLTEVHSRPETWQLVLMPPPSTPPGLLRRMGSVREQLQMMIHGLVAWGLRARGLPEEDADVEMFSVLALDVFEQSARLILTDPERYPVERITRFSRSFFAFAAATPPPPATQP